MGYLFIDSVGIALASWLQSNDVRNTFVPHSATRKSDVLRLSKLFIVIGLYLFFLPLFSVSEAVGPNGTLSTNRHDRTKISRIADAIAQVQPNLPHAKRMFYASAIFRASQKYSIDPKVLISIAHQESSFRSDLPEGRAGETGICQILKRWLRNPHFVAEFGNRSLSELKNPEKNFLFAAWILYDLRKSAVGKQTLPYWSYYNARRFHNRAAYTKRVNRHLAVLTARGPLAEPTALPRAKRALASKAIPKPKALIARNSVADRKYLAKAIEKIAKNKELSSSEKNQIRLLLASNKETNSRPSASTDFLKAARELGVSDAYLMQAAY